MTDKGTSSASYLHGTAVPQAHLEEMTRRQIVPSGERLLAIFTGYFYDPRGARVGGGAFNDYLVISSGHVVMWARDQARDYVDRFPLAGAGLASVSKRDANYATAHLNLAANGQSIALTFDMLPVADMEQLAETIVGMAAAARDLEANSAPAALRPRALGLAFEQLIASRYTPVATAPAAPRASLADKARAAADRIVAEKGVKVAPKSRAPQPSFAGNGHYDPFAGGDDGAVTRLSRLDALDSTLPYGDFPAPVPAAPANRASRLSRTWDSSLAGYNVGAVDGGGYADTPAKEDGLPLADGGNVEVFGSSRKRGPVGRIVQNVQEELRGSGGSASPPMPEAAPFLYVAPEEGAVSDAVTDDEGEEIFVPHAAKPINPARVAWGRAMQNHLAPLTQILDETVPPESRTGVSRFGKAALEAVERMRKDVAQNGMPGIPRDLSLHEITEALTALNTLLETLGTNPAAREMAMAFVNKGMGAVKGDAGRDAIDFNRDLDSAPAPVTSASAAPRRTRISVKNAAKPATDDNLPELALAPDETWLADAPPASAPPPPLDDHVWDGPETAEVAPVAVSPVSVGGGISIKKRRSITVSVPAAVRSDDDLVPADDIRL